MTHLFSIGNPTIDADADGPFASVPLVAAGPFHGPGFRYPAPGDVDQGDARERPCLVVCQVDSSNSGVIYAFGWVLRYSPSNSESSICVYCCVVERLE